MKMGLDTLGKIYNFAARANVALVKTACGFIVPPIPHRDEYRPFYSPWEGEEFQQEYRKIQRLTLVKPERCYRLVKFLEMTLDIEGEIWECGTYRGGTARLISDHTQRRGADKAIRLFDTFGGMPETNPAKDLHEAGDFRDTSKQAVQQFVGNPEHVFIHQGWIPDTFRGLESAKISFAHIDLDIYDAIRAALEFIYPRVTIGGVIVFDDYGFPTCPGAKAAVDEFLGERVVALTQGQAMTIKNRP